MLILVLLLSSTGVDPSVVDVVTDAPSPLFDRVVAALETELDSLSPSLSLSVSRGDGSVAGVKVAVHTARRRPTTAVIVTLGPLGERVATPLARARRGPPVVSAYGFSSEGEGSRRVAPLDAISRDVARLAEILPVTEVGVAVDTDPDRSAAVRAHLLTLELPAGVRLSAVPVDPEGSAEGLGDLSALLFSHALSVNEAGQARLFEAAVEARVPVLDALGDGVRRGALVSVTPDNAVRLRARRIALSVVAAIKGQPAPGFDPLPEKLVVNTDVAKKLGVGIPFEVLIEAEVVSTLPPAADERMSIARAAQLALDANPTLASARARLQGGAERVRASRAALLPSLQIGADALWIDEDRAAGPFPPAERQLQWRGEARQSVFSAEAWRAFTTEDQRQAARSAELAATRLDIHAESGALFLDVLRRTAAEDVQRENLERTRLNLALARIRRQTGVASRDEVFRFEIEVAQNKQGLIAAVATRNQAEIALNIFLAREPEAGFQPVPVPADAMLATDPRVARFMDDPVAFRTLRRFAESVALERAPEIDAARRNLAAAERSVEGFVQALFIPSFDVFATFTHRVEAGGAGASTPGNVGFVVPDELDWQIGVQANLPLFAGFGRYAALGEARADVAALEAIVLQTELAVAGRVRSALHRAGASRPAVRLTAQAAAAAQSTLDLVRDAYRRGRVDIIRLVDAQTQSLTTRLNAANAVYDFQSDFIVVERAMARFSFGPDPIPNDRFFEALAAFEASTRAETAP